VSAKYGQGVSAVREWVLSHMPLGPAYYPKVSQEQRLLRVALQQRLPADFDQVCIAADWLAGAMSAQGRCPTWFDWIGQQVN
jgi:hypothetical protein